MATHSSILDWRDLAGYSAYGHKGSDTTEQPSSSSKIFPYCLSEVAHLQFFCNTSVFIAFIALITVSK